MVPVNQFLAIFLVQILAKAQQNEARPPISLSITINEYPEASSHVTLSSILIQTDNGLYFLLTCNSPFLSSISSLLIQLYLTTFSTSSKDSSEQPNKNADFFSLASLMYILPLQFILVSILKYSLSSIVFFMSNTLLISPSRVNIFF